MPRKSPLGDLGVNFNINNNLSLNNITMIIPPFLNKNSLIGLVSPAGKVDISEIERAQEFLTPQGF